MLSSKKRVNSCTISQIIKKTAAIIAAIAFISTMSLAGGSGATYADGRAECVAELSTGTILHSRNDGARLPMASTTKIMTALIIIEDCELDEEIAVPDEAVGVEGSSIYLKRGEIISVKDLLYGLMMRSGNDSAAALAIHHSGSIQDFAKVMNARARSVGACSTNFTNPSGLPDENHYTTASDLCKIACCAMKNAVFKEIVSSKSYTGKYRSFVNKNKILSRLEGANGVKTGYTVKAGRCLVSSAERDGMDVVCVVLNCPDMYERSKNLIERAFLEYELRKISPDKIFMCGIIPCKIAEEKSFVVKKGEEIDTATRMTNNSDYIHAGDDVGILEIYSKNNLIFSGNLISIVNRTNTF